MTHDKYWLNDRITPRQRWLQGYSPKIRMTRIYGLVYEVSPTAFSVYLETGDGVTTTEVSRRRWVAEMPTLGEAQDLLTTLVGSQS